MRQCTDLESEILEALDMAAVLFDADGRCVLSNARFIRTFFADDEPPIPGEDIAALCLRMSAQGHSGDAASAAEIDAFCVNAIRGYARDMELATSNGGVFAVTSSPTSSGGWLVTLRDTGRDRLGEQRALQMLTDAFDGADMGVLLWDSALRVQRVNKAWCRMLGEVSHGRSILEDDALRIERGGVGRIDETPREAAERTVARMHREPTQYELRKRGGRCIQIATFPTQSRGVLATAIDVTARRSSEAQARDMLEDAVDALGEGVALYDRDLRLKMNNRAFRSIVFKDLPLGAPGMPLFEEVSNVLDAGIIAVPEGQTRESMLAWVQQMVASHAKDVELPMADGRIIEVSNSQTPLGSYLISMRDITARKEGERAAREADDLVRTIVDASPTTFLVSRVEDGKIIYMPEETRKQFGDLKTTQDFFLDPSDRDALMEELLTTGQLTEYPTRYLQKDGSIMHGLTSARVTEYKGEQVIVSSTRDVTEQLAIQAELERQKEIAHQNEKFSAMGELLAGVAHELNNPLSVVVGYALMLQDKLDGPVEARQVREISVAAERCSRIVKTFLAMARQRPAEVVPADLNEIITVAVEVASHGLHSGGAEIVLDLAPDLPLVPADADQFVQVFINLVVNAEHALKARGTSGRLAIRSRHQSDTSEVKVTFTDNGDGIPVAMQSRVFEPFFTTKDVGSGTGIGLAFCHRVVTSHGGRISVSSEPGRGAAFAITVPVCTGDALPAETNHVVSQSSSEGSVLVVDDDASVLSMIGDVLANAGYTTTTAAGGEEALALCAQQSFDAILCDIRMPGMDGHAFFAALDDRAPKQAAQLAFLSGDMLSQQAAMAVRQSNRPSLDKPATPSDLLALVERLIEKKR